MKDKIQELCNIIVRLIKESDDRILNIRGGKGYGVGHPYPMKSSPLPVYGEVENLEQVETQDEPVKISKAFKKGKND
jgi:hypothetical protein